MQPSSGGDAVIALLIRRRTQLCLVAALALSSFITWNLFRASQLTHWVESPGLVAVQAQAPSSSGAGRAQTRSLTRSSPARTPSRTERLGAFLQRRYRDLCGGRALFADPGQYVELAAAVDAQDEFGAVQVGTEMWNRLGLDELDQPARYYSRAVTDAGGGPAMPFTILSYGRRLDQGRALLARIGADDTDLVSYPSLQAAFDARPYLSQALFRKATRMDWAAFQSEFSGKEFGYLLSTLNQWVVLERLRNGTYPDAVFVVEDDVFLVPGFRRKFAALLDQLATLPWEVVFVGTCHQIKSPKAASANLFVADASRCFNAVMLRRSAAAKILEAGAVVDDFRAVDHLFNIYIPTLNLTSFYVYPPLAYEQSKVSLIYPCLMYSPWTAILAARSRRSTGGLTSIESIKLFLPTDPPPSQSGPASGRRPNPWSMLVGAENSTDARR